MVTEIRIYIEGGGDHRESKALLRRGWLEFLAPLSQLARSRSLRWAVILCGSRQTAFEDFQDAIGRHPDALNILLVDSEERVACGPWEHLLKKEKWRRPVASDGQCHLMVQAVETWLIADPDALATYYGKNFRRSTLPRREDLEEVDLHDVMASLRRATEGTQKRGYHKITHCSDLLARIDPARVRARARHCDRLFTTLTGIIEGR